MAGMTSWDPRDEQGNTRPRSWGDQLGGFMSGMDAFSDINAMRQPARVQPQIGQYDPRQQAYRIGDAYNSRLAAALQGAQNRQAPTVNAATMDAARMGNVPQVQTQDVRAAQGQAYTGGDAARMQAARVGSAAMGAAGAEQTNIDQSGANQWRGQQQGLAGALAARAAGQAPSAAEMQLRTGMAQGIAAQASQAAGARGVSRALAGRQLSEGVAGVTAATNQQAAQMRAQESAAAEQSLAGVLQGGREQDIGLAANQANLMQQNRQFNAANQQQANLQNAGWQQQANAQNAELMQQAGLTNAQLGQNQSQFNATQQNQMALANLGYQQQANMANQAAGMQAQQWNQGTALQQAMANAGWQQQANMQNAGWQMQAGMANQAGALQNQAQMDQATQAYLAMGMSREQAQQQAYNDYFRMMATQQMSSNQLGTQAGMANAESQNKANAGIIGAAGSIIGGLFSDERLKEGIDDKAGEREARNLLDALRAVRFEYKNQEHGRGPQLGITAQSAEQSEAGRSFVVNTPVGKMIDGTRAIGPLLAALKYNHERLKRLEQRAA